MLRIGAVVGEFDRPYRLRKLKRPASHCFCDNRVSRPFAHIAAIAVLAPREGEHILDIGCGCGQTTLTLAARVRPTGSVMGVDISKPMLDVALRRARPAPDLQIAFRKRDVQTGDLGLGRFDAAFSRFGVMSLKPDGRLAFVCWRPLNENPWMQAPLGGGCRGCVRNSSFDFHIGWVAAVGPESSMCG
jgi:protein-L-isoaspartate O-methyltransferase